VVGQLDQVLVRRGPIERRHSRHRLHHTSSSCTRDAEGAVWKRGRNPGLRTTCRSEGCRFCDGGAEDSVQFPRAPGFPATRAFTRRRRAAPPAGLGSTAGAGRL
jgi:hypothetical protein